MKNLIGILLVISLISVGCTATEVETEVVDEPLVPVVIDAEFAEEIQVSEEYQAICKDLVKDKEHVFKGDEVFEGADPDSFRVFDAYYSFYDPICVTTDGSNIYFSVYSYITRVTHFDVETFEVVSGENGALYFKDKDAVYSWYGEDGKMEGADPETFELIEDSFYGAAKDKNNIYECGVTVMSNQEGYELLGDYYVKVGSNIYHENEIVTDADADSFVVLGWGNRLLCQLEGSYAKDKNYAYYSGEIIEGADPETFERTPRVGYMEDKNALYAFGEKVRNDFVLCSTDLADLPEGQAFWKDKLEFNIEGEEALFEFCTLPDESIVFGYREDSEVERKTIDWFDSNYEMLQTMDLVCGDLDEQYPLEFLPDQSIDRLVESTLTLVCSAGEACEGRAFYELDLEEFKDSSSVELIETDEFYDCGYRG